MVFSLTESQVTDLHRSTKTWVISITAFLATLSIWSNAVADDNDSLLESSGPSINQSQYFNSDQSNSDDSSINASPSVTVAAQKFQSIPSNTIIPTEGVRWPHRRVYIYMDTSDKPIQEGFRDAVKKWNRSKTVHIVWTNKKKHAEIFAQSREMQSPSNNGNWGQTTDQLGATEFHYNPDTHALIHADSALNGPVLDHSSLYYRSVVAQHELGHALGLAHAPNYANSVMVPTNVKHGITKNDRTALRQLYRDN